MSQFKVRGQNRLFGELVIGGAKNAVLPMFAAACLCESEILIHDCPRIADTMVSLEILESIGCGVEFTSDTLKINSFGDLNHDIPDECVTKMRSSILFMGAMLARCGKVSLALPGGCNLGERGIDMHTSGLRAMGAKITHEEGKLFCEAKQLHGARISLPFPSVGATENLMIAAARAKGETIIENAAREPEVADLALFLKSLGADIKGAGTSTIAINGVKKLHEKAEHTVMPDRIVAGTYLVAAAMTEGEIRLKNIRPLDLSPFTMRLSDMGCIVRAEDDEIILRAPKRLRSVPRIVTKVHPGFPTDMQAQFVAALSIADKRSELTETIFDGRFSHVAELRKMGAVIYLTADKRTFTISGVETLRGTTVAAHDLRCGAALILAALSAEGETCVQNAKYIQRGYADIEKDLKALGADIKLEI
jgi:UDP-N-acetylglucosamine 1-carboxyvinyltransferase